MSQQQDWVNLDQRSEDVRERVISVTEALGEGIFSPTDLYDRNNWGLTPNGALYNALLKMEANGVLMTHEQIQVEHNQGTSQYESTVHDLDDTTFVQRRPQSITARPIAWFMNSGSSPEIRLRAKEERERVLLEFYMAHVAMTGETYFPQLHQLLEAEWRFGFSSEDD